MQDLGEEGQGCSNFRKAQVACCPTVLLVQHSSLLKYVFTNTSSTVNFNIKVIQNHWEAKQG